MKKALTWCRILGKRQLKRPSIIAILLCMVILAISLRLISKDITASISVGFVSNDQAIAENLINHEGIIKFQEYSSKNELTSAVTDGSIQCGYVFDDNFTDRLLSNETTKLIELIEVPENIVSMLSNLVVTATVMDTFACEMLIEDVLNQDVFAGISSEDIEDLKNYYELYSSNGSTFSFDYNALYEDYKGSTNSINIFSYLVTPVRGIVAIFVFIISLTSGLSWYKDKTSNTYANIPLNKRPLLKLLNITIPTVIAMTTGYFSLLLAGICNNYIHEIFTMCAYGLLCIAFTYILSSIIGESIYCGLIPVFILGSIICCPIFFNLAHIIPAMKYLQNIFLPTYYFMF